MNPEKVTTFLQEIDETEQNVTYKTIQTTFKNQIKIEEIKKMKESKQEALSTFDISKLLISRYEKLREHLIGRIELVNVISLNKISERSGKFSLIVMVKNKEEKSRSVDVEDLTGQTTVYFPNENKQFDLIVNDEVVGMFCEKKNDRIEAINLLWPDIPLKRTISRTEDAIYCLFLSDLSDDKEKYNKIIQNMAGLKYKRIYIFFIGDVVFSDSFKMFLTSLPEDSIKVFISKNKPDYPNISHFLPPATLKIEDSIVLLLCEGEMFSKYRTAWPNIPPTDIILNILKKRHLSPIFDMDSSQFEETYFIDTVPDIFVASNFGNSGLTNYKGVTIITNGNFSSEPIYYMINLETRESIKINLI